MMDYFSWHDILLISISTLLAISFIDGKKVSLKRNPKELKRAVKEDAHGIIFGKMGKKLLYSPTEAEGSIGVFSSSGTGKTSAIGIPTLRSWTGTSFTIDISGDICKNCPNMPNKLIYAPENPDTTPYNIFGVIDDMEDQDNKNEALEELAFLLMPDNLTSNDNAKFFLDNGRKILTAALIAFYNKGIDFIEICEKIVGSSYRELFAEIDKSQVDDAIMYINSFEGASEQNTAGCKQCCDDAIKLFATNEKIKKSVRRPLEGEKAVEGKMIEEHNIFIIVADPKLDLYSPLLNIITSQQMQYISNRNVNDNSSNILLFLDEYASLKINATIILEALRKYRKRKCRLMIMTQNLCDLDILYGHDVTRAILANLRFKLLLGGLGEPESQTYFANLIGYQDVTKRSRAKNAKTITTTTTTEKEYIIPPADLDRQGKDIVILLAPDDPGYFIIKKNYYFK
ncbi:type IV secretory system conjugative DNA transfer family protein [Anaerostipes sp.]|uniref:type IV secretory system conjugative DNA transfer family protein n=1 Tax=Anaerostipes sp. TaxID=1872530 RepID=UPI00258EE0E4|nr:type IV secretory system conjugative DNA transfer family protein [Anaerostipes sp.]MCI5622270.1 type IV secretory system conjugative DNA transfer family protein [Anaerostipes sp.]